MARADMESAREAPIATSGYGRAGRVIGVKSHGCDPGCHEGRSVSAQGVGGKLFDQAAIAKAVRSSFFCRRGCGLP